MINLYYDSKDKVYYFNDVDRLCDNCGELIYDTIIIRCFWDKLGSGINYLCSKCKKALKKSDNASFTTTYIAIVDADIPSKAMPIVFSKPSLSCARDMMTWDAAANMEGEKVIDKTVYSGRKEEKVKEYLIESENDNIDLHLEHQAMNNNELSLFMATMKSSVPVIDYDERKVLK